MANESYGKYVINRVLNRAKYATPTEHPCITAPDAVWIEVIDGAHVAFCQSLIRQFQEWKDALHLEDAAARAQLTHVINEIRVRMLD